MIEKVNKLIKTIDEEENKNSIKLFLIIYNIKFSK